jgi:hypothetical protein
MSVLAECVFCNRRVALTDAAVVANVHCPKCHTISLVVVQSPESEPASAVAAATPSENVSTGPESTRGPTKRSGLAVADVPRPPAAISPATVRQPRVEAARQKLAGALGLLCGGLALSAATVPATCWLVIPLGAVGLAAAAYGTLRLQQTRSAQALALSAATLNTVLLVVALFVPARLGAVYGATRLQRTDPYSIQVIPLPGHFTTVDRARSDWVDASAAALQQGQVQVQITAAYLGRVELQTGTKASWTKDDYLTVHLHAQKSSSWRDLARPWEVPGLRGVAEAPTLTAAAGGAVYARVQLPGMPEGGQERRVANYPVRIKEEVLYFEAPPQEVDLLRLEVPAAAWGGKGTFRFALPRAMIETAPVQPLKGGARK